MEIKKYDNTNSVFFVSGMFGGSWIWDDVYPKIQDTKQYLMHEPLCSVSGEIYTLTEKISDELSLIKDNVTLVSNSLGGYVCLDLARKLPNKISSVIISGACGFSEVVKSDQLQMSRHNPDKVAKQLMDLIYFDDDIIPEKFTSNIAQALSKSKRDFINILHLMNQSNSVSADEVLKDVQCPVHAIWGANDEVTPFSDALESFQRHHVTYDLIDECGHSPMLEKPEVYNTLLMQQISKISHFSSLPKVA